VGVIFAAAAAAAAVAAWGREKEEGFADAALLWAWTAVDSSIMSSDESTQVYRTGRSPQTFCVALQPLSSHVGSNRLELPASEAAKRREPQIPYDVVCHIFGVYEWDGG